MKTKRVRITSIEVPEGGREPRDLDDLQRSIEEVGLLHPVTLDQQGRLLAGHRRLEACKGLGWTMIPAQVVSLNELRAELVTLSENLTQLSLTALARAQGLARQAEIYGALHPSTLPVRQRGGPGRGKTTSTRLAPVFAEVAAKKLGTSRRTAERVIEIGRRLDPQAAKVLRQHPVANSQSDLSQLIRLPAAEQRRVAKALARGDARSVKGAIRTIRWADETKEAPTKGSKYTVRSADFMKTLAAVKAGTADLVCTDPEWGRSFTRYDELGNGIARALKPNGYAVVIIGQEFLPHVLDGLRPYLMYRWTVCVLRLRRQVQDWSSGHMSAWLPALVFTKGRVKTQRFESDVIGQHARKGTHGEYEKEVEIPLEIIKRYSMPGDLVVDPFCGLGSTGVAALMLARRFVGGDIDAARVRATAARLGLATWGDKSVEPIDKGAGVPTPRWNETR